MTLYTRIGNIIFREINSTNDALYEDANLVIIASDDYRLVERAKRYREGGIDSVIYPLNIVDSPTLLSLLGMSAWLHERSLQGLVVVEGYGQQRLLEKAYQVVFLGAHVNSGMLRSLASPLHARSLIHLQSLREGGVDLVNEAKSLIGSALTGGDAHKSTILEIGLDIVTQLMSVARPLLYCVNRLYSKTIYGRERRSSKQCLYLYEFSESLDYLNTGAVKNLALIVSKNKVNVLVGCRLFLSDEECWPEVDSAREALARLLDNLGLVLGNIEMVTPEEAAHIAYNSFGEDSNHEKY